MKGPVTILIVDDSAVMRKITGRNLRQAGVQFEEALEANDGWEALALVKERKPDLVLCGINIPGLDSLEFVRQLGATENGHGVPVIMISNEAQRHRAVEALSCGARGYVTKPFTAQDLQEQIANLLE